MDMVSILSVQQYFYLPSYFSLFDNEICFKGWDQSDKYIKVFVTLKNVQSIPKEQVYCKLTDRSMELHVENLENKDYLLVINKLLEPINIEDSHWKQKTGNWLYLVLLCNKQSSGKKH
jgi:hypothetical protein